MKTEGFAIGLPALHGHPKRQRAGLSSRQKSPPFSPGRGCCCPSVCLLSYRDCPSWLAWRRAYQPVARTPLHAPDGALIIPSSLPWSFVQLAYPSQEEQMREFPLPSYWRNPEALHHHSFRSPSFKFLRSAFCASHCSYNINRSAIIVTYHCIIVHQACALCIVLARRVGFRTSGVTWGSGTRARRLITVWLAHFALPVGVEMPFSVSARAQALRLRPCA